MTTATVLKANHRRPRGPGLILDPRGRDSNDVSGKMPPQSMEAEGAVLAAALVDVRALVEVSTILRPEHFYSTAHQWIFRACLDLRATDKPVDNVTVLDWLRARNQLGRVEPGYLNEIVNSYAVIRNVSEHARIVHNKARRRRALDTLHQLLADGYADSDDDEYLARAHAEVGTVCAAASSDRYTLPLLDVRALAAPLPPLDYLVRAIGLVAGGGAVHLFAGYGHSGKTLAIQSLLLSLAAGRPVWGAYDCRPRRVVHVDLEQGRAETTRRYQRLARGMGVGLEELGENLVVVDMPDLLLAPENRDRWLRLMGGRDMVVIDSIAVACRGFDENKAEIREPLDLLGRISNETGCRVSAVHHARKPSPEGSPGGRYSIRGSSALYDAVDSAYLFSGEKGEPKKVEHTKARSHGQPVDDFALVISGNDDEGVRVQVFGAEILDQRRMDARADAQARRDANKVRNALRRTPGLGTTQLRELCSLSGDRLTSATDSLGAEVQIREEKGEKGRPVMRHYLVSP